MRHRLLDEVRVIKVVLPHAGPASELRDRFLREARTASRLGHPNVARILDFLIDEQGHQVLVLEHIDGLTLKEVLELSRPPSLGLALYPSRPAAEPSPTAFWQTLRHAPRLIAAATLGLVLLLALAFWLAQSRLGVKSSPIDKAEIEELVSDWRAAQNRGDFRAYRDLYAADMTGIKRVGTHVFKYDRDGWLADRARMLSDR